MLKKVILPDCWCEMRDAKCKMQEFYGSVIWEVKVGEERSSSSSRRDRGTLIVGKNGEKAKKKQGCQ